MVLSVCFGFYFEWLSGPSCSSAAEEPRAEQRAGGARGWGQSLVTVPGITGFLDNVVYSIQSRLQH